MKRAQPAIKIGLGGKRRTLGWTLLTLGVFTTGAWTASGWFTLRVSTAYASGYAALSLEHGEINYYREWPPRLTFTNGDIRGVVVAGWVRSTDLPVANFDLGGLSVSVKRDRSPTWRNNVWSYDNAPPCESRTRAAMPIWALASAITAPAALLLRSASLARRRAMNNACTKCGYDLAGLGAGAVCPECGKRT